MSIVMISVFLLNALLAFVLNKRKPALFNLISAIILVFFIGMGFLPKWTIDPLQTQEFVAQPAWKSNNAIIVLGAGTSKDKMGKPQAHILAYARMLEAIRLYTSCKKHSSACKMYLTGGDPAQNGVSEAELMARTFVEAGVDATDLIKEEKSNNTFQNAQFTSELMQGQGFDQVYLVTSGIHMSRALVYFGHFGVHPTPAPGDLLQPIFAPFPIAPNFTYFDASMHEWLGILRYRIYDHFGWNPEVTQPGSV